MEKWGSKKGPAYEGPSDHTMLMFITGYGKRKGCLLNEIISQFGEINTLRTAMQIQKMVLDSVLISEDVKEGIFITVNPAYKKHLN